MATKEEVELLRETLKAKEREAADLEAAESQNIEDRERDIEAARVISAIVDVDAKIARLKAAAGVVDQTPTTVEKVENKEEDASEKSDDTVPKGTTYPGFGENTPEDDENEGDK